ncbi:MAG TPA: hypothetical protein ENN34_02365 [Deltaproteobacteria bacterium]|nr:hypothetical protein [Deltaproteobacteria bacterium]
MNMKDEMYLPITINNVVGYARKDFDLSSRWQEITTALQTMAPYYALKEWRRVFRVKLHDDCVIYIKIIDERRHEKGFFLRRLFSTEATRYFAIDRKMRDIGIQTPELLFILGKKSGPLWTESLISTKELKDHVSFSEYFMNTPENHGGLIFKDEIIHEIAQITARLHSLGIYLSLDGRNIFINRSYVEGEKNIVLIDLDHMRAAGFLKMPQRRRIRNLVRFESTIQSSRTLTDFDYDNFITYYNDFYRQYSRRID